MNKIYYALKFKDGDLVSICHDSDTWELIISKKELILLDLREFLYDNLRSAEDLLADIKKWYDKDWKNVKGVYSHMWSDELSKEDVESISVVKIELDFSYKVMQ